MNNKKLSIIFVLGLPGSGKSTMCKRIVEDLKLYNIGYVSTGDLLRHEVKKLGKYSDLIETCIENGLIVPSHITINLLKKVLESMCNNKKIVLIDGFPRNLENNVFVQKHILPHFNLKCVLLFDCDENICTKRILQRSIISNRKDDNISTIKKRINGYKTNTCKVLQYYSEKNKVIRIDSNRNLDKIHTEILDIIKTFLI